MGNELMGQDTEFQPLHLKKNKKSEPQLTFNVAKHSPPRWKRKHCYPSLIFQLLKIMQAIYLIISPAANSPTRSLTLLSLAALQT